VPADREAARGHMRRDRHLATVVVSIVIACLLATTLGAPATGRDWTPQIKAARSAQVYWERTMRAADQDLRGIRRAMGPARERVKRTTARARAAQRRDRQAQRQVASAREVLRKARHDRAEARAAAAEPPALDRDPALVPRAPVMPPELLAMAQVLGVPGLAPLAAVLVAAATPRPTPEGLPQDEAAAAGPSDELIARLERRVDAHRRQAQRAARKAARAVRFAQAARARLASLRSRRRAAIARRENAERNLGAWIVAMERYAHRRVQKLARQRAGIDTRLSRPTRGYVSQPYGRGHDGLDIAAVRGTPIHAAALGVVAYVGWNPWDEHGRAFMVVLAHAGGLETLYGHILPRRDVRVGQVVKKHELIGYMGSTGNSTGYHLHLEVRRGRTTLNPVSFL